MQEQIYIAAIYIRSSHQRQLSQSGTAPQILAESAAVRKSSKRDFDAVPAERFPH